MSLTNVLDQAGMETHLWSAPDGSRAIVLTHGGRILALLSPQSEENFYWTNPALADAVSAKALYASDQWHNSGGDRTWLSPEPEFFLPNYPSPELYYQPRQLDPGEYHISDSNGELHLANRLTLHMYASNKDIGVTIQKDIFPALNPLLRATTFAGHELDYAGYSLRTVLTIDHTVGAVPDLIGVWNLMQLPNGGEMFFSTYSRARTVTYFGSVAPDDLSISDRTIRYRMHADGLQKIGIEPVYLTGRGGYLWEQGGRSSLVIRNFRVNPSAHYADIPLQGTLSTGCAAQSCNINNEMGSFSELEYHSPAIGGVTGKWQATDESQVWAFRGSRSSIEEAARLLLSPEL